MELLIPIFLILSFGSSLSTSVDCDDFLKTKDLKTASFIRDYFEKISNNTDLNCLNGVLKTISEGDRFFIIKRCSALQGEKQGFEFEGKSTMGFPQGFGRLKLHDTISKNKNYCVKIKDTFVEKFSWFEGNFKNGVLDGPISIKLINGQFIYGQLIRGVLHGLAKRFDQRNKILGVSYYKKSIPYGSIWKRVGDHYFVFDPRSSKQGYITKSLLVDLSTSEFIAGTFLTDKTLSMTSKPIKLKIISKSDECIPTLDWDSSSTTTDSTICLPLGVSVDRLQLPFEKFAHPIDDILSEYNSYINQNVAVILEKTRLGINKPIEPIKMEFLRIKNDPADNSFYVSCMGSKETKVKFIFNSINKEGLLFGYNKFEFMSPVGKPHSVFNNKIRQISGIFKRNEIIDGLVLINFDDGRLGMATVVSNTLHGGMAVFGTTPVIDKKVKVNWVENKESVSIVQYNNGNCRGRFWLKLIGDGIMTGTLNSKGRVSGKKIIYVYPDLETAYIGEFVDGRMEEAKLALIQNVIFKNQKIIPELDLQIIDDSRELYYYAPVLPMSFGPEPPELDPLDARSVEVKKSIYTGDGLYASKNLKKGRMCSIYSYYLIPDESKESNSLQCFESQKRAGKSPRHCYKYTLSVNLINSTIFIPPEDDIEGMFLPGLSPKANHKFNDSNAEFRYIESARLGITSGLQLKTDVKKGEEIFVHYGYKTKSEYPGDHPWYWELKEKIENEQNNNGKSEL